MSKISDLAARFLYAPYTLKRSNTVVTQDRHGKWCIYLHGNKIAFRNEGKLYISDGGWETLTTKSRLNALPGVIVHTHRKQLFLNGKEWSGNWAMVEPSGVWVYAD